MFRKLLAAVLAVAAVPAHADWHEASSRHFVVYSEQKPEKLRTFADQLERFDKAMRVLWNLPDPAVGPANRVTVFVVDDINDIRRLTTSRNAAGFYQSRATGPVAFVPRSAGTDDTDLSSTAILLHEYAHHFMFTNWPHAAYPGWFVEGFAEFHATARFEKDGSVIIGYPPQYRARGIFDQNLSTERMLAPDARKLGDMQVESLYGRGWLLTHFLMIDGRRGNQGMDYLKAINSGKSALEAARQSFGDLNALDRELDSYARIRFSARQIPAKVLNPGPITLRRLTPGEEAMMAVRIRSQAGVDEETATRVYARAKKAAAPFPNDPAVQRALAEAAYDAGDLAEAEAAADRALAADPKLVEALCYKAMARMALATKAKDFSPETWKAIRRTIAAANKLDPEDPEPLMLYYRSFADATGMPPALAREGLYKAFSLAPQDSGLRLNAGVVQLRDKKVAEARETLRPLAFNPHGGGLAEYATKIVTAIDSGGEAAALKIVDEAESPKQGGAD